MNASHCAALLQARPSYSDPFPSYQAVVVSVLVVQVVVTWATLAWFVALRRASLRIRQRHLGLVVLESAFTWLPLVLGPLRDATGRDTWSCEAYAFARIFQVCFFSIPLNIRYFQAYARIQVQREVANAKLKTLDRIVLFQNDLRTSGPNNNHNRVAATSSNEGDSPRITSTRGGGAKPPTDLLEEDIFSVDASGTAQTIAQLRAGLLRKSNWYIAALCAASTTPFFLCFGLLFALEPDQYGWGCTGCVPSYWVYIFAMICPYVLSPFARKAQIELGKLGDPLGILWELRMTIIFSLLPSTVGILLLITDHLHGTTARGVFSWEWIIWLGVLPLWWFSVAHQIIHHYRHPQSLTSADKLQDVLRDPVARGYFAQHLINEYSVEMLKFWNEVQDYKLACQTTSNKSPASVYRLAVSINRVFLELGSDFEINVDAASRNKVKGILDTQQPQPVLVDEHLFDECESSIIHMLRGSVMRFLRSPLFKEYMTGREQQGREVVASPL